MAVRFMTKRVQNNAWTGNVSMANAELCRFRSSDRQRLERQSWPLCCTFLILAIPGVENCALVGVFDDDQADERVVLAIEPRTGEDPKQLRRRVAKALRDGSCPIDFFAQPDSIVVCTVPHSGRGLKPNRHRLVEMISEMNRHAS